MAVPPLGGHDLGAEQLVLDRRRVLLEWHGLRDHGTLLHGLDRPVRTLAAGGSELGRVLSAADPEGNIVGAAVIDPAGHRGASVAVAVLRSWRSRGLGHALADRLTESARAGGVEHLVCRCQLGSENADRTARFFGQRCVHQVRLAHEQLVVLRLLA